MSFLLSLETPLVNLPKTSVLMVIDGKNARFDLPIRPQKSGRGYISKGPSRVVWIEERNGRLHTFLLTAVERAITNASSEFTPWTIKGFDDDESSPFNVEDSKIESQIIS